MAHTVYSRAFALNGYVRLSGAASDWDRRRHCRRRRRRRWLPRAVPAGEEGRRRRRRWRGEDTRRRRPSLPARDRVCVCLCVYACARVVVYVARARRWRRRMRSHRKPAGERVRPARRPSRRRGLNEYATETAHQSILYSTCNPICPPRLDGPYTRFGPALPSSPPATRRNGVRTQCRT